MSENTDTTADEPIEDEGNALTPRAAALQAEKVEADAASDAELVAQRTADTDEEAIDEHVKVFVLPPGPKPTEANGFSHEANFAATRQYAISQGLRPTGDVRHVSTKPFGPGGKSWALTYAVPAVPAERFDFREVHVVTDNEDPNGDGHVTGQSGQTPDDSNADAEAKAKQDEAKKATAAAKAAKKPASKKPAGKKAAKKPSA